MILGGDQGPNNVQITIDAMLGLRLNAVSKQESTVIDIHSDADGVMSMSPCGTEGRFKKQHSLMRAMCFFGGVILMALQSLLRESINLYCERISL